MKKRDDLAGMAVDLGRLVRKAAAHGGGKQSPLRMHALGFVAEHSGMTMSAFASLMKISPSTATMFVDKLVRAKLLRRGPDAKNRKIVRLYCTVQGERAVAEHRKHHQAVFQKIFSVLSATDRAHLARIFSVILSSSSSPSA